MPKEGPFQTWAAPASNPSEKSMSKKGYAAISGLAGCFTALAYAFDETRPIALLPATISLTSAFAAIDGDSGNGPISKRLRCIGNKIRQQPCEANTASPA